MMRGKEPLLYDNICNAIILLKLPIFANNSFVTHCALSLPVVKIGAIYYFRVGFCCYFHLKNVQFIKPIVHA